MTPAAPTPEIDPAVAARFWTRVEKGEDCWRWTRPNGDGYGSFWNGKRNVQAHRWSYEYHVGPIPEGLQVDHTCHDPETCNGGDSCRHRACVNPAHLEPVTQRENILRGVNHVARQAKQTECSQGHDFTPENTYVCKGKRYCRTCHARRQRERSQRSPRVLTADQKARKQQRDRERRAAAIESAASDAGAGEGGGGC